MPDFSSSPQVPAVRIGAYACLTAFGDAVATHEALCAGRIALAARPVLGRAGGDAVPLALFPGRELDETPELAWLPLLRERFSCLVNQGWGSASQPVILVSSNYGVGSLFAARKGDGSPAHLRHGPPHRSVEALREAFAWGPNVTLFSHACVSSHVGLIQAARLLEAGLAERVLVFAYDLLSPFVTGGFHALKIFNQQFPAPYQVRETGSIGLGDGAAFAVLSLEGAGPRLGFQSLFNELHHFTANKADGSGFEALLQALPAELRTRRFWIKGHGTGTLEAGRLEADLLGRLFPQSPLVGWKGSLGHTLGSCGLVELGIVLRSLETGRVPGTPGATAPFFSPTVRAEVFDGSAYEGVLCTSNAFGGAHAALYLCHA